MPTISMFFGIIIRMYTGAAEHNPPHIHAYYQDDKAIFDIASGDLTQGRLHRDELMADWELASQGELPFKIEPLH
jgi:hypothetical protein